jgi:hypothetical protein
MSSEWLATLDDLRKVETTVSADAVGAVQRFRTFREKAQTRAHGRGDKTKVKTG